GHISRDCPSPRQQNPRFTQSRTCYKCGEDGHIASRRLRLRAVISREELTPAGCP
ncbi:hypothetical protein BOTBODRAFT_107431, partial [Botryobasidium botryosum FD-172 SS1]